jgi:hypothetical protein
MNGPSDAFTPTNAANGADKIRLGFVDFSEMPQRRNPRALYDKVVGRTYLNGRMCGHVEAVLPTQEIAGDSPALIFLMGLRGMRLSLYS